MRHFWGVGSVKRLLPLSKRGIQTLYLVGRLEQKWLEKLADASVLLFRSHLTNTVVRALSGIHTKARELHVTSVSRNVLASQQKRGLSCRRYFKAFQ